MDNNEILVPISERTMKYPDCFNCALGAALGCVNFVLLPGSTEKSVVQPRSPCII